MDIMPCLFPFYFLFFATRFYSNVLLFALSVEPRSLFTHRRFLDRNENTA